MPDIQVTQDGVDIAKHLDRVAAQLKPAIVEAERSAIPAMISSAQHAARELNIVGLNAGGARTRKRRQSAGTGSLRDYIANAIGARFDSEQITLFIEREKMPPGKESIPKLTTQRRWRHPVFGNREVWVEQRGRSGWFQRAIRGTANEVIPPEIMKAIERLINDSARR